MLAFAIAAVTVLLAGTAVSWLKRVGKLTPMTGTLVGLGAATLLVVMIVLSALVDPQLFSESPGRGTGERPEPTKIVDVQLPTL